MDEVLIPNEELAERSGGRIPDELKQRIKRESIEAGLSGGLHAREHGGQGWSKLEWFLVEEQLGRSTNALSWYMPGATTCSRAGPRSRSSAICEPALRGELHDAYAVTEANAGSDPSADRDHRGRSDGGWVINGEKWFVTYGDIAAVYIVMANVIEDGERLPTLFLVDREAGGDQRRRRPPVHPHLPPRPSRRSGSPTSRFRTTP